jgi:pSer/pThr/pTyr-binding forkhead associated (FHA) protein
MMACPVCGAALEASHNFCPQCGHRAASNPHEPDGQAAHAGPASSPQIAHLEFLGGPEDGRIVRLSGDRVTVGRREDNDVQIFSDGALSRQHAYIFRKEGRFWIEDRKSSFGTWVEGERVPVQTAAPMNDGSLIRLARTLLTFHWGEPEEVPLKELAAKIES